MTDIIIPPPSDATNRLFSEPRILHREQVSVADLILEGWIFDEKTGKLYQPLFGLTAKTLDGKERTVVEGDIVYFGMSGVDAPCGVIVYSQHGFIIATGLGVGTIAEFLDEGSSFTILGHVSDIANGVPCWECGGTGYYGGPRLGDEPCPACDGTGRRRVVVKGETNGTV